MERIKSLNRYQQSVLIFMLGLILIFTILYPKTISRKGYAYKDQILLPARQDGCTVYSGKIQGVPAAFSVYEDKTVVFRCGDKTYGPYTAREDPSAIPENHDMGELMTGVELRRGEELLFRGGVVDHGTFRWMYHQDGTWANSPISIETEYGGDIQDEYGNMIDPMEPGISTILDLMSDPPLTHKGDWQAWFCGVFLCLATAISILFADELFRWNLAFQIRNVESAEPSEWELTGRYIGWTILPILALVVFIVGLQYKL